VTWIAWLALTIVNMNGCVAFGLTPLLAVVVSLRKSERVEHVLGPLPK
jgi:hypothetical protein